MIKIQSKDLCPIHKSKNQQIKMILSQNETNASLSILIDDMLSKNLISTDVAIMLKNSSDFELYDKQHIFLSKTIATQYSVKLKSFANTLHFLSPNAFEYVISSFDFALPNQSVCGRWFESVDGSAGFTKECFTAIKSAVNTAPVPQTLCSLMIDEIAIRSQIEFDGEKMHGYINFGDNMLSETSVNATECLVFMLVSINISWKLPVAYFLTNSLNGKQKSNLVRECIQKSEECGVKIVSLTFNETPSNIAMAKDLGCKLDILNRQPWFLYNNHKIFIFYEVCNTFKLIRNQFEKVKILSRSNGTEIKWEYILSFIDLQGVHFINEFDPLSEYLAGKLQWCLWPGKIRKFKGCEETITFIRLLNKYFEILNNRTDTSPDNKISSLNIKNIHKIVDEAITYLEDIICGNRKNVFIGFIVNLDNCLHLFHEYFSSTGCLKTGCLPTNKLCHSQLKLLLSSIQTELGFKNNPTARQFREIYKKLLFYIYTGENDIENGNCM